MAIPAKKLQAKLENHRRNGQKWQQVRRLSAGVNCDEDLSPPKVDFETIQEQPKRLVISPSASVQCFIDEINARAQLESHPAQAQK